MQTCREAIGSEPMNRECQEALQYMAYRNDADKDKGQEIDVREPEVKPSFRRRSFSNAKEKYKHYPHRTCE